MSTIFDKPFEGAIEKFKSEATATLFPLPALPDKNDGPALKKQSVMAQRTLTNLPNIVPPVFEFDFQGVIAAEVSKFTGMYDGVVARAQAEYDKAVQAKNEAYRAEVNAAEERADASVSGLTKAYDELLTYKDKIKDAVIRYNIKPSDMSLDDENLTREDMAALISTATEACKHIGDSKFRQRLAAIYTPVAEDHDGRLWQAILLLAGMVLLAPFVFIGIVAYMVVNLSTIYRYVDGLRIADKLMFGINFQRFRDTPDIEAIPGVDDSVERAKLEETIANAEVYKPDVRKEEFGAQLRENFMSFNERITEVNHEVTEAFEAWKASVVKWSTEVTAMFKEFQDNRVDFCDSQSESYALTYDATVGLVDETLEVKQAIFDKNIIFASREKMMLDFQRLLLANMLLNVRPRQLSITIYDPERLGQDYATFITETSRDFVQVETKGFDAILDACRLYSQQNFTTLDTKSITDYNIDAEAKKMVTLPYKLLFIATPDASLYKNAAFLQFITTSVRSGVHIWMVGDQPIEGCAFYSSPFEGIENPYPVTQQTINKAVATYCNKIATLKDKGILYIPSFQERYLPREKWWTYNTDSGIDLHLGLENGDPSKGFPITLCDAPVHCLCAGATGAGKSAFINQCLATLTTKYPPSALELILIDFKVVEFAALRDPVTELSRIPHARILAGTTDGEYVVSVFEYLMEDMLERNRKFNSVNTKKLEDYNKYQRAAGHPELCLPRTLLLIDEFQVMFTQVEPKVVEKIQGLIQSLAKLARNAGVHMLFTSQSMTGTMSKDVKNQFAMRIALRCAPEVSDELIGSKVASTITAKFGYMYSNENGGAEQKSTKLWRSPFLPDEDWFNSERMAELVAEGKRAEGSLCLLDKLNTMVTEHHEIDRKAIFYDSRKFYMHDVLEEWLSSNKHLIEQNPGLCVLGERTNFSTKKAPVHLMFQRTDSENLVLYAFENMDLCNLIRTVYTSLSADPRNIIVANSADPDYWNMCGVKNMVDPGLEELSRPSMDPSEWLDFLEDAIAGRKRHGMEGKRPIYFFAIRWDKQLGIYRGDNFKTENRWGAILQDGPAVDVHVILCCGQYKDVKSGHMILFNHAICGMGPSDAGYKFIESGKTNNLYGDSDAPTAIYKFGGEEKKFKIYKFEYDTEFTSRELDI